MLRADPLRFHKIHLNLPPQLFAMELKDIAAVSGKPGLFKIIKPTRSGLVLESLDDKKAKLITGPNHRVSVLNEISVYTVDVDKTVPLQEILVKIKKEFDSDPGVDGKSDAEELQAFMQHIVPDYDPQRVYVSDMKKIVSWYHILHTAAPETLNEPAAEEEKPEKPKGKSKKAAAEAEEADDDTPKKEVKKAPKTTKKAGASKGKA